MQNAVDKSDNLTLHLCWSQGVLYFVQNGESVEIERIGYNESRVKSRIAEIVAEYSGTDIVVDKYDTNALQRTRTVDHYDTHQTEKVDIHPTLDKIRLEYPSVLQPIQNRFKTTENTRFFGMGKRPWNFKKKSHMKHWRDWWTKAPTKWPNSPRSTGIQVPTGKCLPGQSTSNKTADLKGNVTYRNVVHKAKEKREFQKKLYVRDTSWIEMLGREKRLRNQGKK